MCTAPMPVVEIRVPVFLTEDKERVLKAIANVLHMDLMKCREVKAPEEDSFILECTSESFKPLEKLRSLLRTQRTLDAARTYLEKGYSGGVVRFYLNKQAAYTGKVSFCAYEFGESPLGAITVTVHLEGCNPEKFMNWLAPRTVQGVPVAEETDPC